MYVAGHGLLDLVGDDGNVTGLNKEVQCNKMNQYMVNFQQNHTQVGVRVHTQREHVHMHGDTVLIIHKLELAPVSAFRGAAILWGMHVKLILQLKRIFVSRSASEHIFDFMCQPLLNTMRSVKPTPGVQVC